MVRMILLVVRSVTRTVVSAEPVTSSLPSREKLTEYISQSCLILVTLIILNSDCIGFESCGAIASRLAFNSLNKRAFSARSSYISSPISAI